jgi:hypothetical protein
MFMMRFSSWASFVGEYDRLSDVGRTNQRQKGCDWMDHISAIFAAFFAASCAFMTAVGNSSPFSNESPFQPILQNCPPRLQVEILE